MIKISISTDAKMSSIFVGESIHNVAKYIPAGKQVFIITDATVYKLYQDSMKLGTVIVIPEGEGNKTLTTVEFILRKLIDAGADRSSYLLGFGGGIVTDITGFVASIFMRGISFGFVSTTLLSQVDASVGGKNGVNLAGYKNMVGVFNQPDFVLCDPKTLNSLEDSDFRSGFSEIIKAAIIADKYFFEYIEAHVAEALNKNSEVINHLVARSIQIKADVVSADEREKGERKKLNLGHTFAHSIEKNLHLIHGQAVSIGLVEASQISVRKTWMTQEEADRVIRLLEAIGLPSSTDLNRTSLFEAMHKDKKKQGDTIEIILPVGIGKCQVEKLKYEELKMYILNEK